MNIKLIKEIDKDDFTNSHSIYINNEQVLSIFDLSYQPEDAIIGRGLIDGDDIIKLMKRAYQAGKSGEDFVVEEENHANI